MTSTPPPANGPQASPPNGASDIRQHADSNSASAITTTPPTTRRGLPGWAWAALGALVVVAVVVAGSIIAGRHTAGTQPNATSAPGISSSQSVTNSPSTTSTSSTQPTTPAASASPTVTGPTQVGGWTVEILEYSPDVNDILAAADHPVVIEGHKYVGVKLRITNNHFEKADPFLDLGRYIVGTSKGTYYEHYVDTGGYMGDEYLSAIPWLEPDETGEGWLYYQVPGDFTPTGVVFTDDLIDNPTETLVLMPTTD